MNDEKRLPRWAQMELMRLRSNLEHATKEIEAYSGRERTPIEIDPYRSPDDQSARMFLPERTMVRFQVGPGYIDCMLRYGRLEVVSSGSPSDTFVVHPQASNVVSVYYAEETRKDVS